MKVLHVITTIDRGGAENQLLLLVREQVKLGHEVSVFPLKGKLELEQQFAAYGATILSKSSNVSFIFQILALKSLSKKFTVIHAHLPRAEILTALTSKGKFVLSRHNCESFIPSKPGAISSFLSRVVCKRAYAVIAISETVKIYLEETNEVAANQIKIVRYGFDKNIKYSDKQDAPILQGNPIIGTISRLTPQKDLQTLILAFSKIVCDHQNARLIIVGEGILKESLQVLTSKLGIADKVDWLGRTSSPLEVISQMTTFVMTSKYEGFGLVVLEAISQGVPVIASNNPTFSEIFHDHPQNLFRMGDVQCLAEKMISTFEEVARNEIIEKQESLLEVYSPSRMILQMERVYKGNVS